MKNLVFIYSLFFAVISYGQNSSINAAKLEEAGIFINNLPTSEQQVILQNLINDSNRNRSVHPSNTNVAFGGGDTDGDGVLDDNDLDDDNDGILDVDESLGTSGTNLLSNGGLNGPVGTSNIPPSWSPVPNTLAICEASSPNQATADTCDEFGPGASFGLFGIPQEGISCVTGLYAYFSSTFVFHEGLQQSVNFTAGVTYTLSFYQADCQQSNATDGTGFWRVFLGETQIFDSQLTTPNTIWSNNDLNWEFQSFTFTPTTSGTEFLRFLPYDDDAATGEDGVRLAIDNVVLQESGGASDTDNDGIVDTLDLDSDNDGISDLQESGLDVLVYDSDLNGVIDGSDFVDANNNGLADALETEFGTDSSITPVESPADSDTVPNFIDLDSDGDTIPDSIEAQLTVGYEIAFANDGDVTNDDSDGDGVLDVFDTSIGHGGNFSAVQNTDATDLPDYLDLDSDNDTLTDIVEVGNTAVDLDNSGSTNNDEGINGYDNTLETLDNYQDPDFSINIPSNLPDMDGDVLTGGDVDYRDAFLFAEVLDTVTICEGSDSAILFNGTPNGTLSYTINGGTIQTIVLDASGEGSVIVTMPTVDVVVDLISIELAPDSELLGTTYTIEITDTPLVDLGPDVVLCDGETIILNASTPGATYEWQDGSNSSSFLVSSAGTYAVEVTVDGCSATDEVIVTYNPLPVFDLGPNLTVCENETVTLDVTTANATYEWQDGSTNPTFNVTSAGTYSVEVTVNGCSVTDSVTINFDTLPIVDLGLDVTLCEGETIILDASTASASYEWQDGSTNSTFTVNSPGTYTVEVTVGACTVTDTIEVFYDPLPTLYMFDTVEACTNIQGEGVFNLFEASNAISNNLNTVSASFYTNFSDAESAIDPILNPDEYTSQDATIYIRLENVSTQCFDIGSFDIETIECEIFIPEGFSPNGDGTNDTFNIVNLDIFPNHTLEIFNRYGMSVYKGNASKEEWDGKHDGKLLPTGTYYYVIQLNNDGSVISNIEEHYVGWVYMIHDK